MSLLLDALDRAERERREQAARGRTELSLEPTEAAEASAQAAPSIPTLTSGDARSLFNLDQRVPLHRRTLIWAISAALVGIGGGVFWWILTLQPPDAPPMQASAPPTPPNMVRSGSLAGADPTATANAPTTTASAEGVAMGIGAKRTPGASPSSPTPGRDPGAAGKHSGSDQNAGVRGVVMMPAGSGTAGRSVGPVAASPGRVAAFAGDAMRLESEPADRSSSNPPAPVAAGGSASGVSNTHPGPKKTVNAPSVDIRLFRSPETAQVDPGLIAAWQALREGRLNEAQAAYQKLEQSQPTSVDVQLGLARLAAEQGRRAEARQHYQRALLLEPQNATARAGLAVMEPAEGQSPVESQLRANATDPLAQAALGARLGAAGQWPEAEQAWFEALRGDPENPDLLFNLGVALDHLGQSASAIRHYQDALQAARKQRAHFDPHLVEQRLHALAAD